MDRLESDFQGIHVLNASAKDFKERLRELAAKLKASCGLDAVCGEVTKDILNAMPKESTVFVYGILSNEAIKDIDPRDLLFDEKELRGFCMLPYVEEMGLLSKLKLVMELRKTLRGVSESGVTTEFGLDNINEALEFCKNNVTKGKVIIKI
jgi:NADPH:quinone reductase-like Zn-dependent oxidoreductase